MVNLNHPNTMKDKELEKEKEKFMKLMGLPFSTLLLQGRHDQGPWEVTNPAGSALIPRVMVTNIIVYAISIDLRMDPHRRATNNVQQHGVRANQVINNMDDLHMAASEGDIIWANEVVRKNKKLLWCKDSKGNLPLHLAVENGHKEVASFLVSEYPQGSYALNSLDISPLYLAVMRFPKDLDLVKSMFSNLVRDNNVVDNLRRGKSVVRAAIKEQNREMIQIILESQRDLIKYSDEDGLTPLSCAAFHGYVDIVEYIIGKFPKSVRNYKNNDKSYPIHKACLGGDIEVLKVFHSKSPESLGCVDPEGRTILHLAAKERGNKLRHVVSYLLTLNQGRELLRRTDENGFTALELARRSRNHQVEQDISRIRP